MNGILWDTVVRILGLQMIDNDSDNNNNFINNKRL